MSANDYPAFRMLANTVKLGLNSPQLLAAVEADLKDKKYLTGPEVDATVRRVTEEATKKLTEVVSEKE